MDILTDLFVQHLLSFTDMYQSHTRCVVWQVTQLHTMFGTCPGQHHHGSGYVQLALVLLAEIKNNNYRQQYVKYIECLHIDYIFN